VDGDPALRRNHDCQRAGGAAHGAADLDRRGARWRLIRISPLWSGAAKLDRMLSGTAAVSPDSFFIHSGVKPNMAEEQAAAAQEQPQQQFAMQRIYNKDVSFESPATPNVFKKPWQPKVNVDLNTRSNPVDEKATSRSS
jgi:hypothetical protein